MFLANQWEDYEALDTGAGEKLERWGKYVLARPDPQTIWPPALPAAQWQNADAHYLRTGGGGHWEFLHTLPEEWVIRYQDLRFYVRPTGFKHTGLFPEQAVNWDWMRSLIAERDDAPKVLNLFGYTGGATAACAKAGAHVTHVDAAKGMVQWAKRNAELNQIPVDRLRFIVEDANAFVQRELRRGRTYDAILMDPPSYGRGPGGEVWKLENEIYSLVEACANLLSDRPLFFLINSYTTGLQPAVLYNLLERTAGKRFRSVIEAEEIGIPVMAGGVLPCGAAGRCYAAALSSNSVSLESGNKNE